MKATFLHSCGGWYTAEEDHDGFHWQPAGCQGCYDTPAAARAAADEDDEDEENDTWRA